MHGQWGRFAELYHCRLGISYPTVRSRLHELIERLKEQPARDEERKRQILADIKAGRIPPKQGMRVIENL